MTRPTMTEGQDRAFAFLTARYGDARFDDQGGALSDGNLRITGVDEDGDERARWIVKPSGFVIAAYDPDGGLAHYQPPEPRSAA